MCLHRSLHSEPTVYVDSQVALLDTEHAQYCIVLYEMNMNYLLYEIIMNMDQTLFTWTT